MKAPSSNELLILRILIVVGVIFIVGYLIWFFSGDHFGYGILYWPLTFAFLFFIGRILAEWYYYSRITFPNKPTKARKFSVDLFTTYCPSEPKQMVIRTLEAMKNIEYPHATYLCDEANDSELKKYCESNGIFHVTRADRTNAKAGNINNALAQAKGELCLILDPDHVPSPKLLDELVPYFENPQVGFVQSVQAYYNRSESFVSKAAAQQTYMFYGPLMLGMNGYGTVPAIGANCFFRRTALDNIGGHAVGLAEDMHTSLKLHAYGWKSIFHPEILTRGLVPATLASYTLQQLKWSKGTWDILLESFPNYFFNLSWAQRVHYLSGGLFYMSGFVFLINFLIPIISLISSLFPWKIDFHEFLFWIIPIVAQVSIIRHYVQKWVFSNSERGFHVLGGILLASSWWIYCLGFLYAVFRVKIPYVPTPKNDRARTNIKSQVPNISVIVASAFAIWFGLTEDLNPYSIGMAGFALINIIILSLGILISFPYSRYRNSSLLRWISNPLKRIRHIVAGIQRSTYSYLRRYPLQLTTLCILGLILFSYLNRSDDQLISKYTGTKSILTGLTSSSLPELNTKETEIIDLVTTHSNLDTGALLDPISNLLIEAKEYRKLPYYSICFKNLNFSDELYSDILNGNYDELLIEIADKINNSNLPIFLHTQLPTPELRSNNVNNVANSSIILYHKTWKYLHKLFQDRKCNHVIWVWPLPSAINWYSLYPGNEYVDWIAIKPAQFIKIDEKSFSSQLTKPMPPIVIYEDDSTTTRNFSLKEVNLYDKIVRAHITIGYQNLPSSLPQTLRSMRDNKFDSSVNQYSLLTRSPLLNDNVQPDEAKSNLNYSIPKPIKGVTYNPFSVVDGEPTILTKNILIDHFTLLKEMGANTIRKDQSNIYDYNILKYAEKFDLNVVFGFDLPPSVDYFSDSTELAELEKSVLSTITKFRDSKSIMMWNLGNDTYTNLNRFFAKPYLFKVQKAYLTFLYKLIKKIKAIDQLHPVSDAIYFNNEYERIVTLYENFVPNLDVYGFDSSDGLQLLSIDSLYTSAKGTKPYYISKFGTDSYWHAYTSEKKLLNLVEEPPAYQKVQNIKNSWEEISNHSNSSCLGGVLSHWQDDLSGSVTWSGIIDFMGRPTSLYQSMEYLWSNDSSKLTAPKIQIIWQGNRLLPKNTYQINAYINNSINNSSNKFQYEWYVHEEDNFGRIKSFTQINESSPSFVWRAPKNPGKYRLYLLAKNNNGIVTSSTSPFVVY